MKGRIKVFGYVLVVMFMLGVATAPSASAEVILPQFSTETGFKGESGLTTFETVSGTKVTCRKSTAEGTPTSSRLGPFHIHLKECESSGVKCTGLGEEAGVILILGTWHLVSEDGLTMLLLLLEEVHLTCSALVLVNIKGSIAEPITPVNSETTEYTLESHESKGVEEPNEYDNDATEAVAAKLLASTNHGTFEGLGEESKESKLTTEKQDRVFPIEIFFASSNLRIRQRRPATHPIILVLRSRLTLRAGTAFRVLNDCFLQRREPCEFEWESGNPVRGSISEFEYEYEIVGSRRIMRGLYLLTG